MKAVIRVSIFMALLMNCVIFSGCDKNKEIESSITISGYTGSFYSGYRYWIRNFSNYQITFYYNDTSSGVSEDHSIVLNTGGTSGSGGEFYLEHQTDGQKTFKYKTSSNVKVIKWDGTGEIVFRDKE